MTGAGISVSAGIPDFRSPKTGLYDNLKEYNLPYPEAIFNIDFFKSQPEPFYKLANEFLNMSKYNPTPTHHFCKMLENKGILSYSLSQNIDNLEEKCGFNVYGDRFLQAHGANNGAHCSVCKEVADTKEL